ncbi:MAG TPA: hypothetical protein VGH75_08320 [Steroidobacteraceae bacterium]|jgi:hypothetical protein
MSPARLLTVYRLVFSTLIVVASMQTLLVVFASAQVMSAMQGEWPTRFLLYAASALLVVTMDRTLARSC